MRLIKILSVARHSNNPTHYELTLLVQPLPEAEPVEIGYHYAEGDPFGLSPQIAEAITSWSGPVGVFKVVDSNEVPPEAMPAPKSEEGDERVSRWALERAFILGANVYDFDQWLKQAAQAIESEQARAIALHDWKRVGPTTLLPRTEPLFADSCIASTGMSRKSFDLLWENAKKIQVNLEKTNA